MSAQPPAEPDAGLKTPNAEHTYYVREDDLPLSCPMPDMKLWNSHPRVYLPIRETGQAQCPYCSAIFILKTD